MSNRIKGLIKGLGKINLNSIKNAIGAKVGLWAGAGLISILPYILGAAVVLILLVAILGGGADQESQPQIGGVHSLSPGVEQWRELVEREAAAQGMSAYVSLLLAIIQVETGGVGTRDIMQSSESAGHPRNYWQTEELSVRQGVKHLKSIVNILEGFGAGFESNSKLLAQAYNFGSAFAGYVGRQGGEYSLDIAEQYSKNVVAPSLGNYTGITYSYVNAVSNNLGKPYLYRNGGNFMYGDLVAQYINPYAEGELAPPAQPLWVTSHFGGRDSPGGVGSTDHRGIDFACSEFVTPILTVLEGTVHRSGIIGGLGNALVIKHNDNFYTTYGHMSSLNVKAGDTVRTGQQIGVCGNTGTSTGPHLHFEVAPDASFTNQIDPYPYFQHLLGG
nr:lysozyme family protein [Sporosarcina sp. BP05]